MSIGPARTRTRTGQSVDDLEAEIDALGSASSRAPNWCGRWTIGSGQTAYLWADATVLAGTATGSATNLDPIRAHVVAGGFPAEPDEYSIEADRLVLTSSPPSQLVGEVLTARVYRALT